MDEELIEKAFRKSSYTDFEKYKKNRLKSIILKKERTRKIGKFISDNKKSCLFCGGDKDLIFHHINPNKKENTICTLKKWSQKRVENEIKKCWCLCQNCHIKLHQRLCDPLPMCYEEMEI